MSREAGHSGRDRVGRTLRHHRPLSWWFAVSFRDPQSPEDWWLHVRKKQEMHHRIRNNFFVRDKRLVCPPRPSNGTARLFPPAPLIGLWPPPLNPILPRWARAASSRGWQISEIPMTVDPVSRYRQSADPFPADPSSMISSPGT